MNRIPIAGCLAIAIVLTLTVVFVKITEPLTGLPYLQPVADDAVVTAKWSLFDRAENSLVLVGDSSCMHGLQPDVFSKITGKKVVNLGTLSSMTTVGFSEMAHSVSKIHKIEGIVYSILPQSLEVSAEKAKEFGQIGRYLTAYGNQYDLYNVSLRERLKWLARKYQFNQFPAEFEGSYEAFRASVAKNSGFYPEHTKELVIEEVRDEFIADDFSISGLIAAQANARKLGIPIFFVINPKPAGSVTENYINQVNQYLTKLRSQHPDLQFLGESFYALDDSKFGTETHLTPEAALVYSEQIADKLARHLGN